MAFLHYDPVLGLRYDFEMDENTGIVTMNASQDVNPLLDRQNDIRNSGRSDAGIKNGMWHYASIPPVVQIEMRKKGIDIYSSDKAMINRMLQEIDRNYPYLKTTNKTHRAAENRHI